MSLLSKETVSLPHSRHKHARASARIVLLVLACFLLGVAVSALWFHARTRGANATRTDAPLGLTDSTRAALQRLDSPVEIRFYSLLDPATVPDSLRQFSQRIDALLSAYEQSAGGKITLKRFTDLEADASAASADRLKAFNLDKGNACFLGMTLAHGQQKQTIPELLPQWEPALPYDLARALTQVSAVPPPAINPASNPVDPGIIAEVRNALPNLDSASAEDAERVLRQAALNEFSKAAKEMETQLKAAEQRLQTARQGGSEPEQQAAVNSLRQLQAEQAEQLKRIAAKSQAQIEALRQIKAGKP